jgi:hypothetical protein
VDGDLRAEDDARSLAWSLLRCYLIDERLDYKMETPVGLVPKMIITGSMVLLVLWPWFLALFQFHSLALYSLSSAPLFALSGGRQRYLHGDCSTERDEDEECLECSSGCVYLR